MQMYRDYEKGEIAAGRTPLPSNVWIPQNAAAIAAGQGIAGSGSKRIDTMFDTATTAQNSNATIGSALAALNTGKVITGAGANLRAVVARTFDTMLGRQTNEQALSTNTDAYLASTRALVMARAKALGTGNGFTDTDRQFVEAMAGGDLTRVESSLRKMLQLMAEGNDRQIKQYNQFLGSMGNAYTPELAGAYPPVPASELDFSEPKQPAATGGRLSPAEAAKLQPGTPFVSEDGRQLVRR
jgi:hypothetical protein